MAESTQERLYYHVEFDVIILGLIFGLFRVVDLRRHTRSTEGKAAIVMLVAVIAVIVVMDELPYRTFSHRDFEAVEFAGAKCYITGKSGNELLLFCPNSNPPRNRVAAINDPKLMRLGIVENVFRGLTVTRVTP